MAEAACAEAAVLETISVVLFEPLVTGISAMKKDALLEAVKALLETYKAYCHHEKCDGTRIFLLAAGTNMATPGPILASSLQPLKGHLKHCFYSSVTFTDTGFFSRLPWSNTQVASTQAICSINVPYLNETEKFLNEM